MEKWVKVLLSIIITLLFAGLLIFFIVYAVRHNKKEKDKENEEKNNSIIKTYIITEKERERILLLNQCIKAYGKTEFLVLDEDEIYNNETISNDKILSVSTLEINIHKGESIQIFKESFELQDGEYACISYELNGQTNMVKVHDGNLYIPENFHGEISETKFTFIIYFNYDPSLYENSNIESENEDTSLAVYESPKPNNRLLLRKLGIFSKIKNFFKKNAKKIVQKVVAKVYSFACTLVVDYLFKEAFNTENQPIKGVTDLACDQLGEYVGTGVTKIIFNPESKPAENYKELIHEESLENNLNTYLRNIFDIAYINNKLDILEDQSSIEIKGEDFTKYASDIIPSEEKLTKTNHIFSPLGNLILSELSSAYLKPKLLVEKFNGDINFFKQYNFEWTYTDEYDETEDYPNINTFLIDNKYILFNNMDCNKTVSKFDFYAAIQKIGENIIKIYKNPEYIYLTKFSDFKAAFWIKNIKDINTCFHFNNNYKDLYVPFLNKFAYSYKKINLAEYDISNIYSFDEFITYTSAEEITMPFYSNNKNGDIYRFISNNYRLKKINWNEFTIKSKNIVEFISYTRLGGIDLDLKFLTNAIYISSFFAYDDLNDNNIKNFDTSKVTTIIGLLIHTMGNDINFIKNMDTSELNQCFNFIENEDIIKLDISTWNKTKLNKMNYFISYGLSLKYLDFSGYIKIKDNCLFDNLFWGSNSIEALNIKGWDFTGTISIDDNCNVFGYTENSVISSVMIYIEQNMLNYLDVIKKFFKINNENQYTVENWPY